MIVRLRRSPATRIYPLLLALLLSLAWSSVQSHPFAFNRVGDGSAITSATMYLTGVADTSLAEFLRHARDASTAKRVALPLGTVRTDSTVWLTWKMWTEGLSSPIMEFPLLYAGRVDVFEIRGASIVRRATGMSVGRDERDVLSTIHAVESSVASDTIDVIVRISGPISKVMAEAPVVKSRATFEDGARMGLYRNGMFFGLVLALVLYNLFVFVSTKERVYAAYVINTMITGVWMYAFESLPTITMPDSIGAANLFLLYCGSSTAAAAGTWFVTELLQTRTMAPRLHLSMMVLIVVCLGYAVVIGVFMRHPLTDVVNMLGLVQAGLCMAAGVIGIRKGKREAVVFMAAYGLLLCALFYWTASNLSLIPRGIDGFTALRIGTAVELLVLSMLLADRLNTMRKAREEADRKTLEAELYRLRTVELEEAHRKSNTLLLNVLPETIAERMKAGEDRIADSYENVCVVFADIAGFTTWSARLSPAETVGYLDTVFSAIDELADAYGMEKIKTIGDCYMVVAGVPDPSPDAAHRAAHFCIALRDLPATLPPIPGTTTEHLRLRIGMDLGAVVAGVIGKRKFSFDLWGSVVNMASRMESHGSPGRIRCTANVFHVLSSAFAFSAPEDITVKGSVQIRTYFLEHSNNQP